MKHFTRRWNEYAATFAPELTMQDTAAQRFPGDVTLQVHASAVELWIVAGHWNSLDELWLQHQACACLVAALSGREHTTPVLQALHIGDQSATLETLNAATSVGNVTYAQSAAGDPGMVAIRLHAAVTAPSDEVLTKP